MVVVGTSEMPAMQSCVVHRAWGPWNTEDLLSDHTNSTITAPAMSPNREGEELDRAFDALGMK